jgi:RNA polymerase sigma-70 factor (ECF subfamily)
MARTDVQLMLDVKAGDEASFELLLRKYRTPLVGFLYRMVGDAGTAEDLAQEVFLRVYRARRDYTPSAKFTTWMFRIARNVALNARRDSHYRQREVSLDENATGGEDLRVASAIPDRRPNIESDLAMRDRTAAIQRAILALPEKQRTAVLLHKYEGMDYAEIGKVLGCSESALKSLLFRAYEVLRVELAPLIAARGGVRSGQPGEARSQ